MVLPAYETMPFTCMLAHRHTHRCRHVHSEHKQQMGWDVGQCWSKHLAYEMPWVLAPAPVTVMGWTKYKPIQT